ncbi:protein yellow [Anabrus simplex]|uniref:protein yellow n=1 Tax=Anabrus simplex TaxID=316456 RepID=UPI0035A2D468
MRTARYTLCILATLTLLQITASIVCNKEQSPLVWTGGIFHWPCPITKSLFQSSGRYIAKNVIATRAQMHDDVAFLALPRFKSGIPATLAKVSLKAPTCQAVLEPYPCWSLQEEGNCNALQSVVDIFLDSNEVLWVLDVGITKFLEEPIRRCPPKVVGIDIKTGKIAKVIDLSPLVCPASRLQYLVVDYSPDGNCFLYISDAATRSILVFNISTGRGFRVVLPLAVALGSSIRDVLYIALVVRSSGVYLYFTYLSGKHMFAIKVEFLRSGSCAGKILDIGLKHDRMVILGTDNGSAIFFRLEGRPEVYRWDTNKGMKVENFDVVHSGSECFLATHALADYKHGRMRILESNFPDYIQNKVGCGAVQYLIVMQTCR